MNPQLPLTGSLTRRQMLQRFANGFGMVALAGLLAENARPDGNSAESSFNPLAVRPPHFTPRAQSVIFLFMSGWPSHVDTFDPKPRLLAENGRPLPFPMPRLERTRTGNLLASPFRFQKHGQAGIEVSELFPKVASRIDDICVIRSLVADNINHNGACLQMNTGEQTFSRPSMGSWLVYRLASQNPNLPHSILISPAQPP